MASTSRRSSNEELNSLWEYDFKVRLEKNGVGGRGPSAESVFRLLVISGPGLVTGHAADSVPPGS